MKMPLIAALAAIALCGCSNTETALPTPVAMTAEAVGHYCQMNILNHSGPKAQVHLQGYEHPIWFAQVRDALAYDRMPEETAEVVAIFVSDMAKAPSWELPGEENWIEITEAIFVEGSRQRGGMGAPELVPFSDRQTAEAFASDHGGRVIEFGEVTDEMVLAPIDLDNAHPAEEAHS